MSKLIEIIRRVIKEETSDPNGIYEQLSQLASENPAEAKRIWKALSPQKKNEFKKHMEATDAAGEGNYEGFLYLIGVK